MASRPLGNGSATLGPPAGVGSTRGLVVAVVEDLDVDYRGLSSYLDEAGIRVTARVEQVEQLDTGHHWDAVICDLSLYTPTAPPPPGARDGSAAVAFLVEAGCRVLCISRYSASHMVADAIGVGALGYVSKERPTPELLHRALVRVAAARPYLSQELARVLIEDDRDRPLRGREDDGIGDLAWRLVHDVFDNGDCVDLATLGWSVEDVELCLRRIWRVAGKRSVQYALQLSDRQMDILRLYNTEGWTPAEIGTALHVSIRTVHAEQDCIRDALLASYDTELKRGDACRVVWHILNKQVFQ